MNIFIDTSVVYTDPFWKRNFATQILDAAKDNRITIFIAELVVKELRHNLRKQLDKEISSIKNSNLTIRKIALRHKNSDLPAVESYLKDYDEFIQELFIHANIVKLESSKDFFDEIVDRAVTRKKPFTDNRSEFKDAVIWLTYYKYAKEHALEDCHLLTNNVKDFTESDNKKELHSELKKDYDKFKIHLTLNDFYKEHKNFIDKPIIEFKNWINGKNIDDDFVFDLLSNSETDSVFDEISRRFEDVDPSFYSTEDFYVPMGGYSEVGEVYWYSCSDIEIDIVKDYAIISGSLNLEVDLELYGYNSVRDPGDEKFPYVGSKQIETKVLFNFVFDKDEKVESFEVTDVI
jgi:rRNA-processing protein FCF1